MSRAGDNQKRRSPGRVHTACLQSIQLLCHSLQPAGNLAENPLQAQVSSYRITQDLWPSLLVLWE